MSFVSEYCTIKTKLTKDPTKTSERKIQNLLRKIKSNIPVGSYKKLYPTGSSAGQFYGLELKVTVMLLCTKIVHFSFNGEIHQQLDGVVIGSTLGPVIAEYLWWSLKYVSWQTVINLVLKITCEIWNWFIWMKLSETSITFQNECVINRLSKEVESEYRLYKTTKPKTKTRKRFK